MQGDDIMLGRLNGLDAVGENCRKLFPLIGNLRGRLPGDNGQKA